MRTSAWMLAGAFVLPSGAALAADGDDPAAASSTQIPWARWQGRLSLGTLSEPWRLGADRAAPKLASASLMGDYYFSRSLIGPKQLGGFRATSGLVFGARSVLSTGQPGLAAGSGFSVGSRAFDPTAMPYANDSANETATLPYLGVGYTNLSVRSGWSFSADLGLIGQGAGSAVRLGRAFNSSQSLDDAIRDMRMTPLLQLGVSYAF